VPDKQVRPLAVAAQQYMPPVTGALFFCENAEEERMKLDVACDCMQTNEVGIWKCKKKKKSQQMRPRRATRRDVVKTW